MTSARPKGTTAACRASRPVVPLDGPPITPAATGDVARGARLELSGAEGCAPATDALRRRIRALVPAYADDRPLNADIASLRPLLGTAAFEGKP